METADPDDADAPEAHYPVGDGDELAPSFPGDLGPNAMAAGAGALGAFLLGLIAFFKRRRKRERLAAMDDD